MTNGTNETGPVLGYLECSQIADILAESANEIAMWMERESRGEKKPPFEVSRALNREIRRLRRLEGRIRPKGPEDDYRDEND